MGRIRRLVDDPQPHRPPTDFHPATLVLTLALAFGALGIVMAAVMLVVEPQPIPGLGLAQRQDAETGLYVLAFAVVLPVAVIAGSRLSRRIAAGPNGGALPVIAAALAAGLLGAVLLTRASWHFSWGGGMDVLLVAIGAWAVGTAALLARALRSPWPLLARAGAIAPWLWALDGLLLVGVLLAVTRLGSVDVVAALVVLAAGGAALASGPRLRRPPGRLGPVWDVAVLVALALIVPNVVVMTPGAPPVTALDPFIPSISQFHQDFLLGPANQVLGGGVLLHDTASQYGVASLYLVIGWSKAVGIGYGTFGLLDGLLTAAYLMAGYLVLRLAGVARWLATATLAVSVVALVFNREYPVGTLPQEGPLRFGLPLALVLFLVAAERRPARARQFEAAALAVLGLASLWALEAFAFTTATFVLVCAVQIRLARPGERRGLALRRAAGAAVACVAAHLAFAAITLAATGALPGWDQYLAFLHVFLVGDLGELTYDFTRWSPALVVGAAYMASAAALALLLREPLDLARARRAELVALAGLTGYGIVCFAYFVDRSGEHVLVYVAFPAVLMVAAWLSFLLRRASGLGDRARTGVLAVALAAAAVPVAVGWSSIGDRYPDSALAHVIPGGPALRPALARLRAFPPVDPRASAAENLLRRSMPGEERSAVLVKPDLTVEALMRTGRSNRLALGNPREDDFTLDQRAPGVERAVAALRPGDRLLVDDGVLAALSQVRRDPSSPLLRRAGPLTSALQVRAIVDIDRRFRLRPVRRDPSGLTVMRLAPRAQTASGP